MKIEINGVEREGQIVSVPRCGFCIDEDGISKRKGSRSSCLYLYLLSTAQHHHFMR